MTTNNTDRSAKTWKRVLAGMLVGVAVVVALVAGVYTRAGGVNAAVKTQPLQTTDLGSLAESDEPGALRRAANDQQRQVKEAAPSQPAEPSQPAPPAKPGEPSQPAPPAPPSDPAGAPTSPAAPTAPTAGTPAAPAAPASPASPVEPVKEKTKSKDKVKQKDEKLKVEKGSLIEAPHPVYPEEARAQRIEGEVMVAIVVGEEGNVISAKPTSGHELLQGAAKDAAFKARFRPSMVEGKPVKVSGVLSYNFRLNKK